MITTRRHIIPLWPFDAVSEVIFATRIRITDKSGVQITENQKGICVVHKGPILNDVRRFCQS